MNHDPQTRTPTGTSEAGAPATQELFARVYEELRGLAAVYIRDERAGHTLQPTALVHETYLKLAQAGGWKSENEFIAVAASAMRRVLVDHARKRDAAKRGGGERRLSIDSHDTGGHGLIGRGQQLDVMTLDEALRKLEAIHPRQARLVELRVFGGLTVDAAAELVGVSVSTAFKDWEMARAWLLRELGG